MPCVLVTRPREDAESLSADLSRRGVAVMLQPMLRIDIAAGPPPELDGVQALLFTSANGVRALAARSDRRALPAFAVGDATAAEARRHGFEHVDSAGGNVEDLARLVRERCDPAEGALLHAAGSAVAGDLAGLLRHAGFTVERVQLYAAERTAALDEPVRAALAEGTIDYALFFSPRSAASFVSLVRAAGLADACAKIRALCLSAAVAGALSPLAWRGTAVAAKPTQQSLLAALDEQLEESADNDMTDPDNQNKSDLLRDGSAAAVIERFGGIRPMAAKLGVPVTTVQGWKSRGHIPDNRLAAVRSAAAVHGIDLSGGDAMPAEPAADTPAAEMASSIPPVSRGENGDDGDKSEAARTEPAKPGSPETESPDDASPATASAESGPPPQTVAARSGVAWVALAAAVLAILGLLTQRHWAPALGLGGGPGGPAATVGDTAAIDDLTARVGKLETSSSRIADLQNRLERAEQRPASLAAGAGGGKEESAAFAAMKTQLTDAAAALAVLESRLATLETQVGQAPPEVTEALAGLKESAAASDRALAALAARVKALEDRPVGGGEKVAALAVAAGQLDIALESGKAYRAALDRLKSLSDGDPAIAEAITALDPWADTGLPTAAMLADRFARIAPRLTKAPPPDAQAGWLARLRDKTLSLVNMRPIGKQGADSPVTRAERALARGDLATAVTALDGVAGPVGPWRKDAEARLAANAATAAIQSRVVALLTAEAARAGKADPAGRGKP